MMHGDLLKYWFIKNFTVYFSVFDVKNAQKRWQHKRRWEVGKKDGVEFSTEIKYAYTSMTLNSGFEASLFHRLIQLKFQCYQTGYFSSQYRSGQSILWVQSNTEVTWCHSPIHNASFGTLGAKIDRLLTPESVFKVHWGISFSAILLHNLLKLQV